MSPDYYRYDLPNMVWDDAPPYTYSTPITVNVTVDLPNSAVVSSDWQQDLLIAVRVTNNGRSLNLRLANLELVSKWEELPYEYLFESCVAASKAKVATLSVSWLAEMTHLPLGENCAATGSEPA